jgi:hypothetical protein
VGDFNGDGLLDLAVANYGPSPSVSVLLGNGDGTFQTARNFAAGGYPRSVAVGDFNGDGVLDLAVANPFANVSVLLGNGDGTFQAPRSFPAGDTPWPVAVGDFNGDGLPDLAVANEGTCCLFPDGSVSILLNDGIWPTSPAGGSQPRRPLPGPFARDGRVILSLVAAKIAFSPAESAQVTPAAGLSRMGSLPPELAIGSLDQFFAATAADQPPVALSRAKVSARGWMDDWLTAGALILDGAGIGTIRNDD